MRRSLLALVVAAMAASLGQAQARDSENDYRERFDRTFQERAAERLRWEGYREDSRSRAAERAGQRQERSLNPRPVEPFSEGLKLPPRDNPFAGSERR